MDKQWPGAHSPPCLPAATSEKERENTYLSVQLPEPSLTASSIVVTDSSYPPRPQLGALSSSVIVDLFGMIIPPLHSEHPWRSSRSPARSTAARESCPATVAASLRLRRCPATDDAGRNPYRYLATASGVSIRPLWRYQGCYHRSPTRCRGLRMCDRCVESRVMARLRRSTRETFQTSEVPGAGTEVNEPRRRR